VSKILKHPVAAGYRCPGIAARSLQRGQSSIRSLIIDQILEADRALPRKRSLGSMPSPLSEAQGKESEGRIGLGSCCRCRPRKPGKERSKTVEHILDRCNKAFQFGLSHG
jgi:hypothetical protein